MNNVLQLKGHFEKRSNKGGGGGTLPKNSSVKSAHLFDLASQLNSIYEYWKENTDIMGALVSVHYNRVVPKSNRIKILLAESGKKPVDSICGAKFVWEEDSYGKKRQKHVFTHYIKLNALTKSINILKSTADIIEKDFSGEITSDEVDVLMKGKTYPYTDIIAKTNLFFVLSDGLYVEYFGIDRVEEDIVDDAIITIYQTGVETKRLLNKFGINVFDDRIIDGTTLRLHPDEVKLLYNKAPYLIAMGVRDFSNITIDEITDVGYETTLIPKPNNEPVIGVLDTQFDSKVYFSEWVEYKNLLDPNIPIEEEDKRHGTAVSSIIVDGPRGNPKLDDGCGRFRVKHFGVATHKGFSSFAILKLIRQVVSENREIKVWNLSLGSAIEIKENFISPEAAELDRIQSEYDVIFVVAGTNIPRADVKKTMKIGSPADSLNSMVVNAVDINGESASYTRVGPVLSFFNKPDVSYYGGDWNSPEDKIIVCKDSLGAAYAVGTSYAAPWIARKLAYLIYIMGLNREIAKALIIDSAAGWDRRDDFSHKIGYGVVPKRIENIVNSEDDEIRFVMTGTTEEYETYTFNLPVPVENNKHPFYARATLVYFPRCNRNQGVDYTNTEMDVKFGRVHIKKDGKADIKPIDNNKQGEEGLHVIYEEDARKMYRKWDNVKHISEEIKKNPVPRKAYEAGLWGLSIKTKERTQSRDKLAFGVVVTLKEMHGKNRIDDFIRLCMARNWLVNRLDVKNQIEIYAKAEEEIKFE